MRLYYLADAGAVCSDRSGVPGRYPRCILFDCLGDLLIVLALLSAADAASLDEMLALGPVSVVKTKDDGRIDQITVYARIEAPVDAVWSKLVEFGAYEQWMPQVDDSTVVTQTDTRVEVSWSIRVPGPNFRYTAAYDLDPVARTVEATGTAGGLSGGRWTWKLTPQGSGTLVERTTHASAVIDNWIVRQFDDREHSFELGINAASTLIEVRGLKSAIERP